MGDFNYWALDLLYKVIQTKHDFLFTDESLLLFRNLPRGHSQTTFTAIGGGGVREMSTLLNKFGKFY